MEFHKAQLQAMNHFQGPCLTLAGPGSGKTTVLTYRILNLIEKYHVRPENILVITFTKMAAQEMKERFLKLSENRYAAVTFGTFHGFYFTILKHAYNYHAGNIITQQEKYRFIKNILSEYELEITDTTELVGTIIALIGRFKSSGVQPQQEEALCQEVCPPEVFRDIYRRYQKYLETKRYLDFEDMLIYCYELLAARKDILEQWQEKYPYILIDEFQDIDKVQFQTIQLIAEKYRNLFIVGDDDQSIYGFRGACPDYMQEFQKIYPEAVRIDLNVNYRCAPEIVNAAKSLIAHNKNRFEKDITAAGALAVENAETVAAHKAVGFKKELSPQTVIIKEFQDTETENTELAEKIKGLSANGRYRDTAVLVRTNAGAALLIQAFVQKNIPFIVKEQIHNPFEHWAAQDMIAYVMLAMGNRERKTFFRILNRPVRYLSREAFPDSVVDFGRLRTFYAEKSRLCEKVDELQADIAYLSRMRPFAAVNYIRKGIGYEDYLKEYAREKNADVQELLRLLDELQESTRHCADFAEWLSYIETYSEKLNSQKTQEKSTGKDSETDGVQICTMHGAKGLEYENVFLVDVNEGNIPYHKAVLECEVEEERRMFYVAMTRAKKRLFLYFADKKCSKELKPSRFLGEIDAAYVSKQLLDKEKHSQK